MPCRDAPGGLSGSGVPCFENQNYGEELEDRSWDRKLKNPFLKIGAANCDDLAATGAPKLELSDRLIVADESGNTLKIKAPMV